MKTRIVLTVIIAVIMMLCLTVTVYPADCGDVDGSGGIDIDDVVYLITYIFQSGPPPCFGENPNGSLTGHSGCKYHDKDIDRGYPSTQECLIWYYSLNGTLELTHINSVFNCCPDALHGTVQINGSNILISEWDTFDFEPCPCMCLYDLNYQFNDIVPGTYTITFENPNYWGVGEWIVGTIDLDAQPYGEFCIEHDDYPWVE